MHVVSEQQGVTTVPSIAFANWGGDRASRLDEVEAHCASISVLSPANPTFLDELLRGLVLHLSAHFQGFCRDLHTECSQIWIAGIPAGFQTTAQAQFAAQLALDRGNPTYDNLKRDFSRFGFVLDLQSSHPHGSQRVSGLAQMNQWRNKAAHQGTRPLGGGTPQQLLLGIVQGWRTSCDGLATSLDGIMYAELLRIMGVSPW